MVPLRWPGKTKVNPGVTFDSLQARTDNTDNTENSSNNRNDSFNDFSSWDYDKYPTAVQRSDSPATLHQTRTSLIMDGLEPSVYLLDGHGALVVRKRRTIDESGLPPGTAVASLARPGELLDKRTARIQLSKDPGAALLKILEGRVGALGKEYVLSDDPIPRFGIHCRWVPHGETGASVPLVYKFDYDRRTGVLRLDGTFDPLVLFKNWLMHARHTSDLVPIATAIGLVGRSGLFVLATCAGASACRTMVGLDVLAHTALPARMLRTHSQTNSWKRPLEASPRRAQNNIDINDATRSLRRTRARGGAAPGSLVSWALRQRDAVDEAPFRDPAVDLHAALVYGLPAAANANYDRAPMSEPDTKACLECLRRLVPGLDTSATGPRAVALVQGVYNKFIAEAAVLSRHMLCRLAELRLMLDYLTGDVPAVGVVLADILNGLVDERQRQERRNAQVGQGQRRRRWDLHDMALLLHMPETPRAF